MNARPEPDEVYQWLRERAAQTHVDATFHTHLATTDALSRDMPLFVICSYWVQKWQKMAENLENGR